MLIGAAVHLCAIPLWGALSDRIGRRPVYLLGAVGVGVWAFVFIALVDTKNFLLTTLAVSSDCCCTVRCTGRRPRSCPSCSAPGPLLRCLGGYQLASIIAGGLAPIIAVALLTAYDSGYAIAVYVAVCAVTFIAVTSYSETHRRDLTSVLRPARSRLAVGGIIANVETELLRLLAEDAPAGGAGPARRATTAVARDLALRIRAGIDASKKREAELSALFDAARELASARDPGGVLDTIVHRARTLIGTDVSYLTLYDPARGDTYMRATDGSVSAGSSSYGSRSVQASAGWSPRPSARTGLPTTRPTSRSGTPPPIDHAVGEEGLVAICGTPLIVDGAFVGVLFASNRTRRPFSREEVSLLGSLAALAAVTIVQTQRPPRPRPRSRCPRPTPAPSTRPQPTTASPTSSWPAAKSTPSPPPWVSCSAAGSPYWTPTGSGRPRTARRDVDRRRRVGPDGIVGRRQAARIDGIEAGIGAVRIVEDVAEIALVVHLRQHDAIAVAFPVGQRPGGPSFVLGRQLPIRTNGHRIERRHWLLGPGQWILPQPGDRIVRLEQQPSFSHRDDRLALFPDFTKVIDETTQCVERLALALAASQLFRERGLTALFVGQRWIALIVGMLAIVSLEREPLAPGPILPQAGLDDLRLPGEDDLIGRHIRGHHGDEIVGRKDPVHQPDERLVDRVRRRDHDVRQIQENHEHAVARVGGGGERGALRAGIAAVLLRTGGPNDDVLEGLDLLRRAVLEDLEVVGLEVEQWLTVAHRIRVDANEIRFDADSRAILGGFLCGLRRGPHVRGPGERNHDRGASDEISHEMSPADRREAGACESTPPGAKTPSRPQKPL